MASKTLATLVILSFLTLSMQDAADNKIDSQEESPFAGITKEILKEKNMENIGGMVNSFIQSGGAKQMMDGVLQNLATGENSGQLLETLGSLFSAETKKSKDEINPLDVLSGLGSVMGAMQGNNDNPAALLQGLGSLLGSNADGGGNAATLLQGLGSLMGSVSQDDNANNNNNAATLLQGLGSVLANGNQDGLVQGLGSLLTGKETGLNPELIGNLIGSFAAAQNEETAGKQKRAKKATGGKKKMKKSKPKITKQLTNNNNNNNKVDGILSLANHFLDSKVSSEGLDVHFIFDNFQLILKMLKSLVGPELKSHKDAQEGGFDMSSILTLASTFLSQNNDGRGGSNFMDYLPMIMNTINSFTGPEAEKRAESHSGHSWALPPVIEKLHIYFDNFINSDLGKQLISYVENQKVFKVFQDENGNFSSEKFKQLIENHSFRRHWIQRLTNKLVEFLRLVSEENFQKQYVNMGIRFANSFLKNAGFPQNTLLDPKNPVNSITNLADFGAKKYLDAQIDSREYVEPSVKYIQEVLRLAKKSIATKELTDKLTDTINMEIIEPITRVNRAYRFVKSQPSCDKYLFCIVNQEKPPNDPGKLPGVQKALYKGYSLIAAWFLRIHTGTSYWDLYSVITGQINCQELYNSSCDGFYHAEIQATTEYIHNEL